MVDTTNVFITTTLEASGLSIPTEVPVHLSLVLLAGAIKFFAEKDLLASAT